MDGTAKQREHHKILSVILCEFQELTAQGGIKTVVMGKTVVLKCFIQYIIGDTKGHNDLCDHKQTGGWTGKHSSDSYTSFDPDEFDDDGNPTEESADNFTARDGNYVVITHSDEL